MNKMQMLSEPVSSPSTAKPIEVYVFVNPLCLESWKLQPTIRRLQVDYDQYFSIRFVLSTELTSLNTACTRTIECDSGESLDVSHPALPSVAVKAAELQGKRSGYRYLTKLQEHVRLAKKNVSLYSVLIEIAEEAKLDMQEFQSDLKSVEASRAFQCDLYITREMEVEEVPSFVFFNENIEDEGLKVSGNYPYEVYERILEEMLDERLVRQEPPTIEELFSRYHTLSTEEVAAIYHIPFQTAERELKKRMLQQKIERISHDDLTLWRLK